MNFGVAFIETSKTIPQWSHLELGHPFVASAGGAPIFSAVSPPLQEYVPPRYYERLAILYAKRGD
jgi:hypothetical protein